MPSTHNAPLAHAWFTRICMENHSNMTGSVFLLQILLIFGGRCNCYFWDIRLKIYSFVNFNMLFQFVLTKFFKSELFSCLQKVDHLTNYIARGYTCFRRFFYFIFFNKKKILIPLQFFPSPVNPNGQGPQLIVWLFLKQVTLGKQESSVQFLMTTSQLAPVNPTSQLHV